MNAFRLRGLRSGDVLAMRISFRLTHIADGAFADGLDSNLADSIITSPEKFLKYLKEEKGDVYCPKEIVRAVGTPDLSGTIFITKSKKRIAALKRVKNPELDDLRVDCIHALAPDEKP